MGRELYLLVSFDCQPGEPNYLQRIGLVPCTLKHPLPVFAQVKDAAPAVSGININVDAAKGAFGVTVMVPLATATLAT